METFHAGERAVQKRAGVASRMAEVGPRVIRSFMPDQHRAFFTELPWLVAGMVDGAGQPWASALAGPPGFMRSPDAVTLRVDSLPRTGDPLQPLLYEGASIGLLGMQPHTRRRNRMNGVIQSLDGAGFAVQVRQSFGNCPKYIQARQAQWTPLEVLAAPAVEDYPQLDESARQLIALADTFFIASACPGHLPGDGEQAASHGVDVSHRGGKPGFVRVTGNSLTVPDFTGNNFFNTLGNIAAHSRAGLLFIDFGTGDALHLAVAAQIIWEGAELRAFAGALRLLRFEVLSMRRLRASLPLRWGPAELSPVLAGTGSW